MSFLNNVFGSAGIGNATQGLLGGTALGSLEEQQYHDRAQQYANALGQSMLATKNAVAQQVFTGQGAQPIPFDPNGDPAYTTPLSNLVTLWQAKFGDEWTQKFDDDFWYNAAERLKAAGKLEVVKHVWYRIKEDA